MGKNLKTAFIVCLFFFTPFSLSAAEKAPVPTIFDAIKNNNPDAVKTFTEERYYDSNQRNKKDESPFSYALLYYKNPVILKYLLEKQKDVNVLAGAKKWPPLLLLLRRYTDADLIETALQKGIDVNVKDPAGNGALIYAYRYFQVVPVMKMLIDAGADVTQKDNLGYNVLHLAIEDGKRGIVDLMLESGVSPDLKLPDGQMPIQLALKKERNDIVSLLIEHGANLYPDTLKDTTLLMETLKTAQKPETIETLIRAGLDVQDRDITGKTPLMYAVEHTTVPKIIDILLYNGAYPHTKDDAGKDAFDYLKKNKNLQNTPELFEITTMLNSSAYFPDFFELIRYGTIAEVERAINEGADVNERDYNNLPPVILAAQHAKDPAILRALLKNGAVLDIADENGRRPLVYAADSENLQTFKELLAQKVDVNATDSNGDTVLMYLAQRAKNTTLISELLNAGANVNLRNHLGKTALMIAAEFTGSLDVITILLDNGAFTKTTDETGRTAADYAKENIRLRRFKRYDDLMKRLSL